MDLSRERIENAHDDRRVILLLYVVCTCGYVAGRFPGACAHGSTWGSLCAQVLYRHTVIILFVVVQGAFEKNYPPRDLGRDPFVSVVRGGWETDKKTRPNKNNIVLSLFTVVSGTCWCTCIQSVQNNLDTIDSTRKRLKKYCTW